MIVGIDETGTATNGEAILVAAIYIQPSQLDNVMVAFRRWKKLTRKQIPGRPDEIKSTMLDDEAKKSFIKTVMIESGKAIYYNAYILNVDEHAVKWAQNQLERTISQYADEIEKANSDGRNKWAKEAKTLSGWIRKTPTSYKLKMVILNKAIPNAVSNSVGVSIVNGFDEELGALTIAIDNGFIKDKAVDFWKEMLRNNFIQNTRTEPIPQLDTWTEDHPFNKAFVEKTVGKYTVLKKDFKSRFNFYDSAECEVIQIADIVCGLLREKFIVGDEKKYHETMSLRRVKPELRVLKLSDLSLPKGENPYDMIHEEETRQHSNPRGQNAPNYEPNCQIFNIWIRNK